MNVLLLSSATLLTAAPCNIYIFPYLVPIVKEKYNEILGTNCKSLLI